MRVTVSERVGRWLVQVERPALPPLRFQYASRRQARYFAAVFRLAPTAFPDTHRFTKPRANDSPAPTATVTPG